MLVKEERGGGGGGRGVEGTKWREFYRRQSYNVTCSLHAVTFLSLRILVTCVLTCVVLLLWRFQGAGNCMEKASGYSRLGFSCHHFLMSWLKLNLRNAILRLAGRTAVFESGRLGGLLTPVTRGLA